MTNSRGVTFIKYTNRDLFTVFRGTGVKKVNEMCISLFITHIVTYTPYKGKGKVNPLHPRCGPEDG